MRRILVLASAVLLIATACGGEDDDPAAPTTRATTTAAPSATTAAPSPTTAAPETTVADTQAASTTAAPAPSGGSEAHPLVIAAVDFDAGFILIRNDGDEEYDLTGHWLCNRPAYVELPAEALAPGRIIEVETGSLGVRADDGELGIYTSRDFGSADAIVRYVEWGSSGHGRSDTAVAAGVWIAGDFVANDGANIQSTGSNPASASDWSS